MHKSPVGQQHARATIATCVGGSYMRYVYGRWCLISDIAYLLLCYQQLPRRPRQRCAWAVLQLQQQGPQGSIESWCAPAGCLRYALQFVNDGLPKTFNLFGHCGPELQLVDGSGSVRTKCVCLVADNHEIIWVLSMCVDSAAPEAPATR